MNITDGTVNRDLEWVGPKELFADVYQEHRGKGVGVLYVISISQGRIYWWSADGSLAKEADTVEAAKAAAQKDYEQRLPQEPLTLGAAVAGGGGND